MAPCLVLGILVFYFIFVVLILRYELKKYKKNIPYKQIKGKRNFFIRIILGIGAGFHYTHFIGTYDHKKYNTQVFTPKTLECFIGAFLGAVFLAGYVILALFLYKSFGIIGFAILIIPTTTNMISIIQDKRSKK